MRQIVSGDVTKANQLEAVLESIRTSMPPLRGVVHAAGILDDGILQLLDERRVRQVMAPKVEGAWNLHALTRDAALDFFVLFSSVSAIVPGLAVGQSDYAAANAYMDYVAQAYAHRLPIISIQWPSWKQTGIGETRSAVYRRLGFLSHTVCVATT